MLERSHVPGGTGELLKTIYVLILLLSVRAWGLSHSLPAEDLFFQSVIFFDVESHIKGESFKSFCSATLVSNKFAITAAHCVSYSWLEKVNVIHIQVGRYAYVKRRDGKTVMVGYKPSLDINAPVQFLMTLSLKQKLLRSSNYGIGPGEDIALIAFDEPLPLPHEFQYPKIIDKTLFENFKTFGPKNLEAVTINYSETVSSGNPKRIGSLDKVAWYFEGWFVSLSFSRFAPDDSGSPIFAKVAGEDLLLGVVKGRRQVFNYDVFTPVRNLGCQVAQESFFTTVDQGVFCR